MPFARVCRPPRPFSGALGPPCTRGQTRACEPYVDVPDAQGKLRDHDVIYEGWRARPVFTDSVMCVEEARMPILGDSKRYLRGFVASKRSAPLTFIR